MPNKNSGVIVSQSTPRQPREREEKGEGKRKPVAYMSYPENLLLVHATFHVRLVCKYQKTRPCETLEAVSVSVKKLCLWLRRVTHLFLQQALELIPAVLDS